MMMSSISFYLLFAAVLYFFANNAWKSQLVVQRKNANLSLLVAVCIFSLVCGLRFRVGVDCEEYASSYQLILDGISTDNSSFLAESEFGFKALTYLFGYLHLPRFAYMGFIAFLEIFFVLFALKSRMHLIPYVFIILILGPFFFSWMNGLRQTIAACLFFFAMQRLVDHKEWKTYLAIIIIASCFHKSVLLMLPMVLFVFYNRMPNKYICLALLAICVFVGQMPFIKNYLMFGQSALSVLGYTSYSDNLEYYLETEGVVSNYGPRRIVLLLSHALVVILSDRIAHRHPHDKFFKVSYLFAFVYSCVSELLVSVDVLFMRPFMYCLPFVLISQAYSLYYLTSSDSVVPVLGGKIKIPESARAAIFVIALLICCSYTLLANVAEGMLPNETVLFKFYFFHQI